MGTIINILITLIGITAVVIIGIFYYPQIEKLLEERLKIRLSSSSTNHGILGEIFHNYNHASSAAWSDWIIHQDNEEKNNAVAKLINHLEMEVSSWGGVTYEVILALGKFQNEEFLDYFKSILLRCKKSWPKYRIAEKCYEAGLISIIKTNEELAMETIANEVNKVHHESQADAIIRAMNEFNEETNMGPLVVSILNNERISYKSKRQILNNMITRNEEKALEIIFEATDLYLNKKNSFELDELKLVDDLLQSIVNNISDEGFRILLKACNNMHTSATGIRIAEKAIKDNLRLFDQTQLFNLMSTQFDKNKIIEFTLAEIRELNPDEKKICTIHDLNKEFSFNKGPIVDEELTDPIIIPKVAEELYENFKLASKHASMSQEGAGGVLLTGKCEQEKLIFARALASERKWKVFYSSVEDILSSDTTLKTLMEKVASTRPCLVFLDGMELIVERKIDNFSRNFIQNLGDPMVTLVGTVNLDFEVNPETASFKMEEDVETIELLFPKAFEINSPNDDEKNILLSNKLSKLNLTREHQNFEQYNILRDTENMSLFALELYLSKYFRASLLTAGKLIPATEYKKLEASREKYKINIG